MKKDITRSEYEQITDKSHIKNILQNPVNFLERSGKEFFVKREGCALALREELRTIIGNPAFQEQMRDIIEYRTMDYYQRRYTDQQKS